MSSFRVLVFAAAQSLPSCGPVFLVSHTVTTKTSCTLDSFTPPLPSAPPLVNTTLALSDVLVMVPIDLSSVPTQSLTVTCRRCNISQPISFEGGPNTTGTSMFVEHNETVLSFIDTNFSRLLSLEVEPPSITAWIHMARATRFNRLRISWIAVVMSNLQQQQIHMSLFSTLGSVYDSHILLAGLRVDASTSGASVAYYYDVISTIGGQLHNTTISLASTIEISDSLSIYATLLSIRATATSSLTVNSTSRNNNNDNNTALLHWFNVVCIARGSHQDLSLLFVGVEDTALSSVAWNVGSMFNVTNVVVASSSSSPALTDSLSIVGRLRNWNITTSNKSEGGFLEIFNVRAPSISLEVSAVTAILSRELVRMFGVSENFALNLSVRQTTVSSRIGATNPLQNFNHLLRLDTSQLSEVIISIADTTGLTLKSLVELQAISMRNGSLHFVANDVQSRYYQNHLSTTALWRPRHAMLMIDSCSFNESRVHVQASEYLVTATSFVQIRNTQLINTSTQVKLENATVMTSRNGVTLTSCADASKEMLLVPLVFMSKLHATATTIYVAAFNLTLVNDDAFPCSINLSPTVRAGTFYITALQNCDFFADSRLSISGQQIIFGLSALRSHFSFADQLTLTGGGMLSFLLHRASFSNLTTVVALFEFQNVMMPQGSCAVNLSRAILRCATTAVVANSTFDQLLVNHRNSTIVLRNDTTDVISFLSEKSSCFVTSRNLAPRFAMWFLCGSTVRGSAVFHASSTIFEMNHTLTLFAAVDSAQREQQQFANGKLSVLGDQLTLVPSEQWQQRTTTSLPFVAIAETAWEVVSVEFSNSIFFQRNNSPSLTPIGRNSSDPASFTVNDFPLVELRGVNVTRECTVQLTKVILSVWTDLLSALDSQLTALIFAFDSPLSFDARWHPTGPETGMVSPLVSLNRMVLLHRTQSQSIDVVLTCRSLEETPSLIAVVELNCILEVLNTNITNRLTIVVQDLSLQFLTMNHRAGILDSIAVGQSQTIESVAVTLERVRGVGMVMPSTVERLSNLICIGLQGHSYRHNISGFVVRARNCSFVFLAAILHRSSESSKGNSALIPQPLNNSARLWVIWDARVAGNTTTDVANTTFFDMTLLLMRNVAVFGVRESFSNTERISPPIETFLSTVTVTHHKNTFLEYQHLTSLARLRIEAQFFASSNLSNAHVDADFLRLIRSSVDQLYLSLNSVQILSSASAVALINSTFRELPILQSSSPFLDRSGIPRSLIFDLWCVQLSANFMVMIWSDLSSGISTYAAGNGVGAASTSDSFTCVWNNMFQTGSVYTSILVFDRCTVGGGFTFRSVNQTFPHSQSTSIIGINTTLNATDPVFSNLESNNSAYSWDLSVTGAKFPPDLSSASALFSPTLFACASCLVVNVPLRIRVENSSFFGALVSFFSPLEGTAEQTWAAGVSLHGQSSIHLRLLHSSFLSPRGLVAVHNSNFSEASSSSSSLRPFLTVEFVESSFRSNMSIAEHWVQPTFYFLKVGVAPSFLRRPLFNITCVRSTFITFNLSSFACSQFVNQQGGPREGVANLTNYLTLIDSQFFSFGGIYCSFDNDVGTIQFTSNRTYFDVRTILIIHRCNQLNAPITVLTSNSTVVASLMEVVNTSTPSISVAVEDSQIHNGRFLVVASSEVGHLALSLNNCTPWKPLIASLVSFVNIWNATSVQSISIVAVNSQFVNNGFLEVDSPIDPPIFDDRPVRIQIRNCDFPGPVSSLISVPSPRFMVLFDVDSSRFVCQLGRLLDLPFSNLMFLFNNSNATNCVLVAAFPPLPQFFNTTRNVRGMLVSSNFAEVYGTGGILLTTYGMFAEFDNMTLTGNPFTLASPPMLPTKFIFRCTTANGLLLGFRELPPFRSNFRIESITRLTAYPLRCPRARTFSASHSIVDSVSSSNSLTRSEESSSTPTALFTDTRSTSTTFSKVLSSSARSLSTSLSWVLSSTTSSSDDDQDGSSRSLLPTATPTRSSPMAHSISATTETSTSETFSTTESAPQKFIVVEKSWPALVLAPSTAVAFAAGSGAMFAGLPATVGLSLLRTTALIRLILCAFDSTTPLSIDVSPLQLKVGEQHLQYFRGAAIGNSALLGGFALFCVICVVVEQRRSCYASLSRAGAELQLPGLFLMPLSIALGPQVFVGVTLATVGWSSWEDTLLGVFCLVVVLGLATLFVLQTTLFFAATAKRSRTRRYRRRTNSQQARVFGRYLVAVWHALASWNHKLQQRSWEWRDQKTKQKPSRRSSRRQSVSFMQQYGSTFDAFVWNRQWFLVVDLLTTIAVSTCDGVAGILATTSSSSFSCEVLHIVALVLLAMYALALLYFRPLDSIVDRFVALFNAVTSFVLALLAVTLREDDGFYDTGILDLLLWIALVQIWVDVAAAMMTLLPSIFVTLPSKLKRLLLEVRRKFRLCEGSTTDDSGGAAESTAEEDDEAMSERSPRQTLSRRHPPDPQLVTSQSIQPTPITRDPARTESLRLQPLRLLLAERLRFATQRMQPETQLHRLEGLACVVSLICEEQQQYSNSGPSLNSPGRRQDERLVSRRDGVGTASDHLLLSPLNF